MKKTHLLVAAIAGGSVTTLAGTAAAQAPPENGVELGLRTGYGVPLGKAAGDAEDDLSEGISGQIPLWLDVGYRISPNLMVGGYFSYGFGVMGEGFDEACDVADGCSARDLRLGGQVQYRFLPGQSADPWIGGGLGFEWVGWTIDVEGNELDTTASGFEFLHVSGGVDFPLAPGAGIGPFMSLSFAQYDSVSLDCSGPGCGSLDAEEGDIDDKSIHQWLFFGIRGSFVL